MRDDEKEMMVAGELKNTVSENIKRNLLAEVRSGSYQVSKALRNKSKPCY